MLSSILFVLFFLREPIVHIVMTVFGDWDVKDLDAIRVSFLFIRNVTSLFVCNAIQTPLGQRDSRVEREVAQELAWEKLEH